MKSFPLSERPLSSTEEEHERLNLRLSKATLHAAERGRRSLFIKLTAANAERIAELSKERPHFAENNPNAPTILLLESGIREILPQAFFDNPTRWLESQPIIERPEAPNGELVADSINDLWDKCYDVTRVREFRLQSPRGDVEIVSKRLSRADIGTKEVAIHRQAYEAGIPTVKIYGEVLDRGNAYLLMEKFSGVSLNVFSDWIEERNKKSKELSERIIQDWEEYGDDLDLTQYGFPPEACPLWKEQLAKISDYKKRRDALAILSDLYGRLVGPSVYGSIDASTVPKSYYLEPLLKKYWHLESLEDFIRTRPEELSGPLREARISIIQPMKRLGAELSRACHELIFRSSRMGIGDLENVASRLGALCKERGIRHCDLFARNILVEWDFKNDCPAFKPDGSLDYRLIDWEPVKQTL